MIVGNMQKTVNAAYARNDFIVNGIPVILI
jgi:hypothetical protein